MGVTANIRHADPDWFDTLEGLPTSTLERMLKKHGREQDPRSETTCRMIEYILQEREDSGA